MKFHSNFSLLCGLVATFNCTASPRQKELVKTKPNVVFILTDQWRAQAFGFAGDTNVKTPRIDSIANKSIIFSHAVSVCPVCTPYRASLLTGRYPTSTGMFMNDLQLPDKEVTMAEIFKSAGYNTGYIGKWHLDGHGRQVYIPEERRQGFDFWKVLECTHDYNNSKYYAGNDTTPRFWEGYDAFAQTIEAQIYIREQSKAGNPFLLVVSYGGPHAPHETAPERFKKLYNPRSLLLRKNVPSKMEEVTRKELIGYYGHCSALDSCTNEIFSTIKDEGIEGNTIFVFTSDHGEMMGSQGLIPFTKQRPWDESILVPFLLHYPGIQGGKSMTIEAPVSTPEILPTLLELSGIDKPETLEENGFAGLITGRDKGSERAALFMTVAPFGDFYKVCEFRGIRTSRYTYVRNLVQGSWLLYDNQKDPFQMKNLAGNPKFIILEAELSTKLDEKLKAIGDSDLRSREYYIKRWGYKTNEIGGIPYFEYAQPVQSPVYTKLKFFK